MTRNLIDHMMDWYGNITASYLKANEARINKAFDHSRPINIYFQRIDDAVQYADDGGNPFTEKKLANGISLRQRNRHVPRSMQGTATKRRRQQNMENL